LTAVKYAGFASPETVTWTARAYAHIAAWAQEVFNKNNGIRNFCGGVAIGTVYAQSRAQVT
jgi:hypothetical protein